MNERPPERMAPEEIVSEIEELEKGLRARFVRIQLLTQSLASRIRRAPEEDNTKIFARYATSWGRYAAAANVGLTGTNRVSRMVKGRTLNLVRNTSAPNLPYKPPERAPQSAPEPSPIDELIELYSDNET